MTRARCDLRWREQAARLVVEACWPAAARVHCGRCHGESPADCPSCGGVTSDAPRMQRYVMTGLPFDVALVRSYCERLISEADALDLQRAVFADWTRDRGMGPEDHEVWDERVGVWRVVIEKAAHGRWSLLATGDKYSDVVSYDALGLDIDDAHAIAVGLGSGWGSRRPGEREFTVYTCGSSIAVDPPPGGEGHATEVGSFLIKRGGWPGSLAREYVATQRARRRCSRRDCEGGVLMGDFVKHMSAAAEAGGSMTITATDDGCGVACPECERFAATRTLRNFANGGTLRRAAQRLLDTLDGRCPWTPDAEAQASECTHCRYALWRDVGGEEFAVDGRGWIDAGVLRSDKKVRMWSLPGVHVALRECPACNGTGHNIRGTLPPLPAETVERLTRPFAVTADEAPEWDGWPLPVAE